MPLLEEGTQNVGEEDIVTRTIDVGPLNPAALVPLLRPLLPQPAHLVAHPETGSLIVVDRLGNVRKLEAIVRELRARPTRAVPREAKEGA
jgi:general secretion pathway protein D